jgi:hypothetical protein
MTNELAPLSPMENRIAGAAIKLADMAIEADPSAKWVNGGDFLWTAGVVTRGTVDRAARSVRSHIRATGNDPTKLADLNEAVAVLHSAPAYFPPMLSR